MADDAETSAFIESMKNFNTNRKTKSNINIFSKWMIQNGEMRKLEEIPPMELDKVLARFFMLAQKEDGTPYEPTTIRSYQSSINRYLKEKQNIDIMIDKDFRHSREIMSAKLEDLKLKGMGAKKRKADPFTADEIHELYEKRLLGAATPKSLLMTVWMNNCLHFGLRSREEHATLRWGDIEMKSTTDGIQYLEHTERITKTRNGINHDSRPFQAKMFADSGNVRCPVEAYKQYLKRRPQDTLEEDSPFYLGCAKTRIIYGSQDRQWAKTLLVILSEICVMKLESRAGKQTTVQEKLVLQLWSMRMFKHTSYAIKWAQTYTIH